LLIDRRAGYGKADGAGAARDVEAAQMQAELNEVI
jgi:hypothetical protein